MTNETNSNGHANFERRDIGIGGVLYFLLGLAIFGLITHFLMTGLFAYLQKRTDAEQAPVSPLATNAPADTRHLPSSYTGGDGYVKYLNSNFPAPQLEVDERNQLDKIRLNEEQTLSTYGYIDQKAGTVRIPIERAMDLIAQRGLPVRGQNTTEAPSAPKGARKKGKQ